MLRAAAVGARAPGGGRRRPARGAALARVRARGTSSRAWTCPSRSWRAATRPIPSTRLRPASGMRRRSRARGWRRGARQVAAGVAGRAAVARDRRDRGAALGSGERQLRLGRAAGPAAAAGQSARAGRAPARATARAMALRIRSPPGSSREDGSSHPYPAAVQTSRRMRAPAVYADRYYRHMRPLRVIAVAVLGSARSAARSKRAAPDVFYLPGGKPEPGEAPLDCAAARAARGARRGDGERRALRRGAGAAALEGVEMWMTVFSPGSPAADAGGRDRRAALGPAEPSPA